MLKLLAQWLHQKLNVLQQQEKLHVHEKEMQRQKLQQEKNQQQDVNVVHLQEKLRGEEQPEKVLEEKPQGDLKEELPGEEDARTYYSFFSLTFDTNCKLHLL